MGVIKCKQPPAVLGVASDRLSIADTGRSLPSIFWGGANVSVHRKCLPVEGSTRSATAQLWAERRMEQPWQQGIPSPPGSSDA